MSVSKASADLAAFEQSVIDSASSWSAIVFGGRGLRVRADAKTREEIMAQAQAQATTYQRKAMVYAINDAGRAVHVLNVAPQALAPSVIP